VLADVQAVSSDAMQTVGRTTSILLTI